MKVLLSSLLLFCSFCIKSQTVDSNLKLAEDLSFKAASLLQEKKYSEIHQLFGERMAKNFGIEEMEKKMNQFFDQYGKISEIKHFSQKITAEQTYFNRGLVLEKEKFNLVFSLDEENKINSFRLAPFTPQYEWTMPDYVKSESFTELNIEVDGEFPLTTVFTAPSTEKFNTVVVFVHGSGPNDMDESLGPNKLFKDLAYGLAVNNIASIRYNKRSYDYPSEMAKRINDITIDDIVTDDAVEAIDIARKFGGKKVILLGHSLGGHMAPKIASKAQTDGVIVMAGNASELHQLLVPQYEHLMKYDTSTKINEFMLNMVKTQVKNIEDKNFDENTVGPLLPLGLSGKFWLSMIDYKPAKISKQQEQPYLILNGERDYQVPPAEAKLWKNGNKNKNSKTVIYPKLNHMFFAGEGVSIPSEYEKVGHLDEQVLNDIVSWINSL